MYVCGPTVDNLPHLGHGRFTLVWDVARRWFTFRGLEVTYVSNITDIDDKIIARAALEDRTTAEVVVTYEDAWWEAMDQLGVARPDESPHATDYVPEMIELITSFLETDIAYLTSDGVYFDVSRVPDYGLLAGQPLDSLRAGARVEADGGEALTAGLRPVEEREARRAELERALRRRAPRMAHRVRRDVPRASRRGLRPAHAAVSTSSSRTTRTNGPRPSRPVGPSRDTGVITAG